ncbi:hypothetical protein Kostya_109 [Mycobacterium phage Kostya]|uniref:Uncharacterized protein n=2 Tax=Kostyavirus TaxID=1623284 RepID=B5A769_9CAUD|nr:hypothetical protein Kostya_109 [Mycobacterium phage Kostya]ACF34274.1 hypothetical protein Kostya_109 [Mycobacterium phage Kostya]AKU42545.1 hypothetical protein SEA_NOSLEEP_109 [Mycobacterium phage NoSleep]QAY05293.1 hypothetical protein SEA_CZYSZCZON1_109 [Mycobacterium phage Czyszczon1]QFP97280.1 hypothetical protein SEA_KANYE_106 [Mycobacterium phage Kanye]
MSVPTVKPSAHSASPLASYRGDIPMEHCNACGAQRFPWLGSPHYKCHANFVRMVWGEDGRWHEIPEPHTAEEFELQYLKDGYDNHEFPDFHPRKLAKK